MKSHRLIAIAGVCACLCSCKPASLMDSARGNDLKGVQAALQRNENPNVSNEAGLTPLHLAARNGNLEITQILILKGANVNAQTKVGLTPLLEAISRRHEDVALALLASGADPTISAESGRNALDYARSFQLPRVQQELEKR